MEPKKGSALRIYHFWPFFAGIPAVVLSIVALVLDLKAGLILLGFTALYYLASLIFFLVIRKKEERALAEFGNAYSGVQKEFLRSTTFPLVLTDDKTEILWSNPAFKKTFLEDGAAERLLTIVPDLEEWKPGGNTELHVTAKAGKFCLQITEVSEKAREAFRELAFGPGRPLFLLCFRDETELLHYKQTLKDERAVMALVYYDNYEEVLQTVENVRRTLLAGLLEKRLGSYVAEVGGVIRKLEKDRFFVTMRHKAFETMEADKFSILEDIKKVSLGNELQVTISIGIGLGGDSFEQNYEYARAAIDAALGRGGDQAVVKNREKISYYGGKAQSVERNTRVKARVQAHALRELIETRDNVMIMGHPISDMDCIGAAVGLTRAAEFSGKPAKIVVGEVSTSVKPVLSALLEKGTNEKSPFITCEEAKEAITKNTLLIVVDTNRPSYTVCPELLTMTNSVAVIDHHRQGQETVANAVISYVEPFSSSASEMVAELVQYYDERLKLRPKEADAVFAGIVMDTNNFESSAGVRTFEAAAYLRRCGADVTRVRKFFRDSMEDYKLRAETVRRAMVYKDDYIISICPGNGDNPNQTIVAAQAANELLEIRGIKASFVLTDFEGKIYISARSIDEVNVQVMMEKLGGGGHLSVAGAQFTGITMDEAVEKLKAVLEEGS